LLGYFYTTDNEKGMPIFKPVLNISEDDLYSIVSTYLTNKINGEPDKNNIAQFTEILQSYSYWLYHYGNYDKYGKQGDFESFNGILPLFSKIK
jgi:hypothetical protein